MYSGLCKLKFKANGVISCYLFHYFNLTPAHLHKTFWLLNISKFIKSVSTFLLQLGRKESNYDIQHLAQLGKWPNSAETVVVIDVIMIMNVLTFSMFVCNLHISMSKWLHSCGKLK